MSNIQKKYFLAPTWSYPPDDSRGIALGNVIIDPSDAWPPLLPARSSSLLDDPRKIETKNVEWSKERAKSNTFGVYTKFLEAFLGAGVDASVSLERQRNYEFRFDTMTTKEFWPTAEYVEECMKQPEVVQYLKGRLLRKRVYIITGVKYVTGATMRSSFGRGQHLTLGVGADLTSLGVPISPGASIEPAHIESERGSWHASEGFVFAFMVARVDVKRENSDIRPYQYGAMYDGTNVEVRQTYDEVYEISPFSDSGLEVVDQAEKILVSDASSFPSEG